MRRVTYTWTVVGEREPHESSERGGWVSGRVSSSRSHQSIPRRELLGGHVV